MAWDTNQLVIVGRLTRDPEQAYTKTNVPVCKFSIASNRGGQAEEVNFFDIVAWDKLANTCSQYLQKGKQVIVSGRLQQQRFTDKNGQNRSKVEIVASNVQFIGAKPEGGQQGAPGGQSSQQAGGGFPQNNAMPGFGDFPNNESDPF